MSDYQILIVEDDKYLNRALCQLLELEGYQVTRAEDGMQGWEQLNQHSFDLLITDLKMPRMDGWELLRRTRESGIEPPIIVITGHGEMEAKAASQPEVTYTLIRKPFDPTDFLDTVRQKLGAMD